MKTEALKLADTLEKPVPVPNQPEMIYIDGHRMYAAEIIRRLVERIDSQDKHLQGKDDLISRLVEELDKQNTSVFTILTCGCKSEFMGFPSEWDGETRECEPCVNYGSLCEQHFMEYEARPAQYTPQTKPLSDEEIGDCVDDYFGLMALQHKYTYSIDQVQEYGLKLCKAIEERHGIK